MKKATIIIVSFFILLFSSTIFAITTINTQLNFEIIYSVGNGLSMSTSDLTIDKNGNAKLLQRGKIQTNNSDKSKKLSKQEFDNLKKIIKNANVFNLKDSYKCEKSCPTDMNYTNIYFNVDKKTKRINIYAPQNLPKELSNIIKNLNEIKQKINAQK